MERERIIYAIYETESSHGEKLYGVRIPKTGEVREAKEIELILKSVARDHGYYLRKV